MNLSQESELQNDKYRIIRVLGQGGFGISYLATDNFTGESVAVKEFFPQGFCVRDSSTGYVSLRPEMEKYKNKFISEAKKLAQLNHKGIVKVIEVFEENGTAYYAMDYIAGQSLWELIQQRQFSVKESLLIIGKVSKALAHIHSKRMLHLDIKPMNIMIRSADNEPIIIDFGISKTYDAKGNANTTFLPAASPGYSPAEQFEGDVNSFVPQLDIYSLGATFYTLLTRSVPTYPTPLTVSKLTFDSSIPFYVEKAIRTAMAYKQEERFATIKDFMVALNLASPSSSKKKSIDNPKKETDKPIIKSFGFKTEDPYYVGAEIELSWSVQNCDGVYLNGKLQSRSKQTKRVKYDVSGKKRFTLKAVKGTEEVSVTRNFEILPREALKKTEETKIILAEVVEVKKPEIIFFRRIGNEQLYVDDKVTVFWDVKDAKNVSIAGIYGLSIKNNKTEVPLIFEGNNDVTLIAQNEVGEVRETISVKAIRRPEPPRITHFGIDKKDKVYVGDTVRLSWKAKKCREVRLGRHEVVSADDSRTITYDHYGSYAYTLHASNKDGQDTKTIHVIVYKRKRNIEPRNIQSVNKKASQHEIPKTPTPDNSQQSIPAAEDNGCLPYLARGIVFFIIFAIETWIIANIVNSYEDENTRFLISMCGVFLSVAIATLIAYKCVKV